MVPLSKYPLITVCAGCFTDCVAIAAEPAGGKAKAKFRADDPVLCEPPPKPLIKANSRGIDPLFDFVDNSFGERPQRKRQPAFQAECLFARIDFYRFLRAQCSTVLFSRMGPVHAGSNTPIKKVSANCFRNNSRWRVRCIHIHDV